MQNQAKEKLKAELIKKYPLFALYIELEERERKADEKIIELLSKDIKFSQSYLTEKLTDLDSLSNKN